MLERDENFKLIRSSAELLKVSFEIVRNALTVATLGFFYQKTQSDVLYWAYYITINMLTAYITAILIDLRFLSSLFADNTQGKIFRSILSIVVFAIVAIVASQLIVALIHEAVKVQFK